MDKFIARLNIEHMRKQLVDETNEAKHKILAELLAKEEIILEGLLATEKALKDA